MFTSISSIYSKTQLQYAYDECPHPSVIYTVNTATINVLIMNMFITTVISTYSKKRLQYTYLE